MFKVIYFKRSLLLCKKSIVLLCLILALTSCGQRSKTTEFIGCTWDISHFSNDDYYDGMYVKEPHGTSSGYTLEFYDSKFSNFENIESTVIDEFQSLAGADVILYKVENNFNDQDILVYSITNDGADGEVLVYTKHYEDFLIDCE